MNMIQIILFILIIFIVFIILLYNKLVRLNNRTKNAYSSIDNQLKRRNDLIPNLIEVVKGYAAYEKETLNTIIESRNNMLKDTTLKEKSIDSDKLSGALNHLFALSESYPDLKANKTFENLQIELVGTEDKIAYARQFYNDCVQLFNEKILVFPNNIFAKTLKFTEKEYFKVDDKDKELIEVKF